LERKNYKKHGRFLERLDVKELQGTKYFTPKRISLKKGKNRIE